jgi:hypothetical protein
MNPVIIVCLLLALCYGVQRDFRTWYKLRELMRENRAIVDRMRILEESNADRLLSDRTDRGIRLDR